MVVAGQTFGIVGALAAFPRRLAAREVERQHGHLRRGMTRQTTYLVFGRGLLAKASEAEIDARVDAERAAGRWLVSENGFLRLLGLMSVPAASALTRQSLIDQAKLPSRVFDLLSLFDAFEHDSEPYSFRDLILARKYAELIASGASWSAIARSVHRSGQVASLTALSLHHEGRDAIYARSIEGKSELDGQLLFDLGTFDDAELEDLFALAEEAEASGDYEQAAAFYQRYLAVDRTDSVAAFNRANCLKAAGRELDAAHDYARAIKLDPSFVEAWFNLAGLMSERGRIDAARRHLKKAIELDGDYADAVFNLAKLEFDAGDLGEARRWWRRYLELDSDSEWARTAERGVQYVDLHLRPRTVG
ncbi:MULTISPECIES: tetratricopeptide repeat protein [unclassified Ensifer]|uniref:tetratricopeptide repeat protein n=1 Tax=unclassified Ensifer TaxID=2633371 RepID=UPI0008132644|nr:MULTISPECIES: tetratricopeptide repeat protein [unclassified Ensifer]OCO98426.1 O-linked GlcNAc transferase [Ensifer sp. LC11]OCP05596.1 O-linked GlcNAc transferase [Ensifer sp. LC13]OCP13531.1 O-linked GlcNAc transferase [Ensifer sp. LC14]OCP30766.1 O-linked GlcNAc transferase [Ensifer sp. LC499]